MQRSLFAAVVTLAACESAPTPSATPVKNTQTESEAPQDVVAARFVAAPGKDTVRQVEWASVMRANTIAAVQLVASLDGVQPHTESLENTIAKVEAIDVDAEVAAATEAFVSQWKGAEACKAQPAAKPPLAKISVTMANALPPDYAATLKAVHDGSAFDVSCNGVDAMVVLDGKSRVIAMDRLVKRDADPVLSE